MPPIDGRARPLAHGDRPRKKGDLVRLIAGSVMHRLPETNQDVAIEVAELVLQVFAESGLRIIWRPKLPPTRPAYVPPKRGKGSRPAHYPLPRMGESIAEAQERLKWEKE